MRRELLNVFSLLLIIFGVFEAYWLLGPLERDQSIYFLISHLLLEGRWLYSDLWDHKPPAIHIVYALAQLVGGYSIWSIWLLAVITNAASGLGLYILAKRLSSFGRPELFTAAFWALLAVSPNLEATQPNTETFINLLWIWGACLATAVPHTNSRVVLVGLLAGIATLFKPIAIILFLPFVLWRKSILLSLAVFPVLLWGAVYAYFAASGRGEDFYQAVIVYNRSYAGDLLSNIFSFNSLRRFWSPALVALNVPLLIILLAAVRMQYQKVIWLFVLIYIVAALPGRGYLHYYQYFLPPIALFTAPLLQRCAEKYARTLLAVFFALILLSELPLLLYPERFPRAPLYSSSLNAKSVSVSQAVKSMLKPGEWFYEWGAQPGMYFESKIDPKHGVFHVDWLYNNPVAAQLTDKTLGVLKETPPALIVVSKAFVTAETIQHPIYQWILKNYPNESAFPDSPQFVILTPMPPYVPSA